MRIPVPLTPARYCIGESVTAGALSKVMILAPMIFIIRIRRNALFGYYGVVFVATAAMAEPFHVLTLTFG